MKNEVTDHGQELKGYYQNNQLKKITHSVRLSLWKIIREYFYYNNELIFVLETKYQTKDENGFINNPKLMYKNSYYFNNNKLIKKIVKETSDTIDFRISVFSHNPVILAIISLSKSLSPKYLRFSL